MDDNTKARLPCPVHDSIINVDEMLEFVIEKMKSKTMIVSHGTIDPTYTTEQVSTRLDNLYCFVHTKFRNDWLLNHRVLELPGKKIVCLRFEDCGNDVYRVTFY